MQLGVYAALQKIRTREGFPLGNRLTKIYTKTGDTGTTRLGDGSTTTKNALRVETYGTVDELNSFIGLLRAEVNDPAIDEQLSAIQHDLFDAGGELSVPGLQAVSTDYVTALEHQIDTMNEALPPLKDFILPAGNRATSVCHVARTTCRKAERQLVSLMQTEEEINPALLQYLNRLSDWLFVMARTLARKDGGKEVLWTKQNRIQS